jgi:hypothetical protein
MKVVPDKTVRSLLPACAASILGAGGFFPQALPSKWQFWCWEVLGLNVKTNFWLVTHVISLRLNNSKRRWVSQSFYSLKRHHEQSTVIKYVRGNSIKTELKTGSSHPPLWSQPLSFHWMKVTTKLHCLMYFNLWNIYSLCAQGTKRQVIFHCAYYLCPKINHAMLWKKVTGSLTSLSLICLASKILCQLGCHLLWLCGSDVNLLLPFTAS